MSIAALQRRYLLAGRGLLLAAATLLSSGCVITGRDGTRHYLVVGVGVGVISVPEPRPGTPVTAIKVQSLGLSAELLPNPRVTLGYINTHRVAIDVNADATVELSDAIGGPLKISISSPDSQEQHP